MYKACACNNTFELRKHQIVTLNTQKDMKRYSIPQTSYVEIQFRSVLMVSGEQLVHVKTDDVIGIDPADAF